MKISEYNIVKKIKNKGYLILNTLFLSLVFIDKKDYKDFISLNSQNKNFETWKNQHIITSIVDEYSDAYKSIYASMPRDKQIITIYTTTACNARCFYCFEKGIKPLTIKKEDCKKLSTAIINSNTAKNLHITWFGGEPLLNTYAIDEITKQLKSYCIKNGIKYTSSIITNASLVNTEIAKKMRDDWNIKSVQVTLDGCEKKYNKIKNYADNSDFKKVIKNIKTLTNYIKKPTIRINFDKHNLKDTLKLVKYLYNENLRSDKIYIYFAPITSNKGNDRSKKELNKQYKKIFKTLIKYGYLKDFNYFHFHFAREHCQAENPICYCLFPNGNVAKCQREKPSMSQISIYEKDFLQKLNQSWKDFSKKKNIEECKNCKARPLCAGGCKIHNYQNLTKNHCDVCFMYKDCFDAILTAMSKIYLK